MWSLRALGYQNHFALARCPCIWALVPSYYTLCIPCGLTFACRNHLTTSLESYFASGVFDQSFFIRLYIRIQEWLFHTCFRNNQLAFIQSVFSINSGLCCLRFHMMSGKLDNHPHLNPSWFIIVFPCTSGGKTEACLYVVLVRITCMRPMTTLLAP